MKELSLFNVHSLQRLAPFAGLALKTVPDACIPSSFSVAIGLDRFGKEPVRNVPVASGGNLLTYLGKRSFVFCISSMLMSPSKLTASPILCEDGESIERRLYQEWPWLIQSLVPVLGLSAWGLSHCQKTIQPSLFIKVWVQRPCSCANGDGRSRQDLPCRLWICPVRDQRIVAVLCLAHWRGPEYLRHSPDYPQWPVQGD